jgi:hypothetical protein
MKPPDEHPGIVTAPLISFSFFFDGRVGQVAQVGAGGAGWAGRQKVGGSIRDGAP